jgi:hypothetical protein
MSKTLILKREPIGSHQEDIDVPAHVLSIRIERHLHPGHRGKNRRDEYLIMNDSNIMGVVVEAKAHKSAA